MSKIGGSTLIIAFLALVGVACAGSAIAPAPSPQPSAQPTEEVLAFSIDGSIYSVRPDGTALQKLLAAGAEQYAAPEFSPDGQRLAYIVDRKRVVVAEASDVATILSDIDLFLDRTPPTPIASNWSMGPVAVHWSPDGAMLLVSRRRLGGSGASDVLLMNVTGTDLRVVLESGMFIEATWWQPVDGPPLVLVVGADASQNAITYDLDGLVVGRGLPATAMRPAVASLQHPDAGSVLVRSALGSPEPFEPIEVEDAEGSRIVAGGCGATWSPDGSRIAFYNGYGIAVKEPDAPPDDLDLIVSNQDLGLANEGELREDLCTGLGISWRGAGTNVYRADHIGLEFAYPSSWIESAADSPVRPCAECLVFGPQQAAEPYGVRWFFRDLPEECAITCAVGNGRRQLGAISTFTLAGREAEQVQIMANLPLGFVEEFGEFINDREVWTAIRLEDENAIFFVAFYRDGDTAAGEETLAAYDALLASLILE